MRIKSDFALRQVADSWIVLALGDTSLNFNSMLTLNESGVMLWKLLEHGCDRNTLIQSLITEYDVSIEIASADVDTFIEKLVQIGCLE